MLPPIWISAGFTIIYLAGKLTLAAFDVIPKVCVILLISSSFILVSNL